MHSSIINNKKEAPIGWAFLILFALLMMGNNLFTKITLLIFIVYFYAKNYKTFFSIFTQIHDAYWLILFELWAVASISWSVVPSKTIELVTTQIAFFLLSILAAYHMRDKDLSKSLKFSAYIIISSLFLYSLLFPGSSFGPSGYEAYYPNKNILGIVSALCFLIIIYAQKNKLADYFFAVAAFIFLIISQSKTSLGLAILIIAITTLMQVISIVRKKQSKFAIGLQNFILKILYYIAYIVIFSSIFLRDEIASFLIQNIPYKFLTGRGEIWSTVLKQTKDNLLVGIGPGSFWEAGLSSEIAQTSLFTKYPGWIENLVAADGGYIDIIAALGFIGLAILIASYVKNMRSIFENNELPDSKIIFVLILFFIGHNFTESSAYHSTNSLWFIYLTLSFYLIFKRRKNIF